MIKMMYSYICFIIHISNDLRYLVRYNVILKHTKSILNYVYLFLSYKIKQANATKHSVKYYYYYFETNNEYVILTLLRDVTASHTRISGKILKCI